MLVVIISTHCCEPHDTAPVCVACAQVGSDWTLDLTHGTIDASSALSVTTRQPLLHSSCACKPAKGCKCCFGYDTLALPVRPLRLRTAHVVTYLVRETHNLFHMVEWGRISCAECMADAALRSGPLAAGLTRSWQPSSSPRCARSRVDVQHFVWGTKLKVLDDNAFSFHQQNRLPASALCTATCST
jgi:hypothetical protein